MSKFENDLKKCMNSFYMNDNTKKYILGVKKGDIDSVNRKEKTVKRKNVHKYIGNIAALLAVAVIVSSTIVYAYSGKTVWEFFFSQEEKVEDALELYDINGQNFTIGDYTITLEETLYEEETGIGYFVVSYKKQGGKPEIELNKYGQAVSMNAVDNRFFIDIDFGGMQNVKYSYEGNVLYEYVYFTTLEGYDRTIDLVDKNYEDTTNLTGYKTYTYTIKETKKIKKFVLEDNIDMKMSPLGLSIYCQHKLDAVFVEVFYENGESETLIEDIEQMDLRCESEEDENGKVTEKVEYRETFKEVKDVDSIAYIEYNGKRIDCQ